MLLSNTGQYSGMRQESIHKERKENLLELGPKKKDKIPFVQGIRDEKVDKEECLQNEEISHP